MANETHGESQKPKTEGAAKAATQQANPPSSEAKVIKEEAQHVQSQTKEKPPEPAPLLPLEPEAPTASLGNLDFILDVPLQITVNLGNRRMMIKELLQLGQGSVVELEKMAGEPMDVLIGDRLIARGEVVVVNEKFGVRLTDIVSTVERINQLNR